jgi:ssDNA-binding Zn-finger/Zn-ribbon topoisomerase 1
MIEIKVQIARCPKCGHNIKVAATETTFDRQTTREFAKLMEKGFEIRSSSLEEARNTQLYCDSYPKCNQLSIHQMV